MRDNEWLKLKLEEIWGKYFSDIPESETVFISYGKKAYRTLGSIRHNRDKSLTKITITSVFQDENIPEYVVDATIAHEMCHYAHGFFSPLPQMSKHPHRGGLVDKEMIARGMDDMLKTSKKWLKAEWPTYVKLKVKSRKLKVRRRRNTRKRLIWSLFGLEI